MQLDTKCVKDVNPWPAHKSMSLTVFNSRSLKSHFQELKSDPVINKADLICVTETWLSAGSSLIPYDLPGRKLITASKGRGKGVAIYSRKDVQVAFVSEENVRSLLSCFTTK